MPKGIVGWLVLAAFLYAVYFAWTRFVKAKVK